MKLLLVFITLFALALSQRAVNVTRDCSQVTVEARASLLLARCAATIGAIQTPLASALATGEVDDNSEALRFDFAADRVQCIAAINAMLEVTICDGSLSAATWTSAGFDLPGLTDATVRVLVSVLRNMVIRAVPAPLAAESRCTVAERLVIRNGLQTLDDECTAINNRDAVRTTCNVACSIARNRLARAIEYCSEDRVRPTTELSRRLRAVNGVCRRARIGFDTAQQCKEANFTKTIANLRAECAVDVDGAVSVQCRVAVSKILPVVRVCLRLMASVDADTEIPPAARRWLRAIRQRVASREADLVVTEPEDGSTEFEAEAEDRLLDRPRRFKTKIGIRAAKFFFRLEDFLEETRENVVDISFIKMGWIATGARADTDSIDFVTEQEEIFEVELDTAEASLDDDGEVPDEEDPEAGERANLRFVRRLAHRCACKNRGICNFVLDHVCSSHEDESRHGVRSSAGVCKHTMNFDDIPHPDPTVELDFVLCLSVDYNSTVSPNVTVGPRPEVATSGSPEARRTDIAVSDLEEDEIRIGKTRFAYRRWVFARNSQGNTTRLRVRARCSDAIENPADLAEGADTRRICCLRFVRPTGDMTAYTSFTFDPSVDGGDSDEEQIPIPTDDETTSEEESDDDDATTDDDDATTDDDDATNEDSDSQSEEGDDDDDSSAILLTITMASITLLI